jgi:hypothetical protein
LSLCNDATVKDCVIEKLRILLCPLLSGLVAMVSGMVSVPHTQVILARGTTCTIMDVEGAKSTIKKSSCTSMEVINHGMIMDTPSYTKCYFTPSGNW